MVKYEHYDVWDFVKDEYFLSWVRNGDPEAEKFWKKWLTHHPHKEEDILLARSIASGMQYASDDTPSEKESIEMFETIVKGRQKVQTQKQITISQYILRYAAVFILGVGMIAFYMYSSQESTPIVEEVPVKWIQKENPRGMKSTIWLSDGTKVRLNAETLISYPEQFSDSLREVIVEGEAFFEVKRNETKPFIVKSNGVETRVLGTSFNVKAYTGADRVEVGVTEGKVRVTGTSLGEQSAMDLLPNQMSVIDLEAKRMEKVSFDPAELLAWRDWTLRFQKQPLRNIFYEIERWYAVDIEVGPSVDLSQSYSGVFENEPLDAVLKGLAHNAEFSFTINENKVKIK